MRKVTIEDLDLTGKRVLMRVDFNVPLEDGKVANDARIRRALPSIKYVLEHGGKLILMSHLGRPKGKVVEELRMNPVAERLEKLLGRPVKKLDDCVGPEVESAVASMKPGEVVLLENLRFHPGEKACDEAFVDALARLGDVYVNDAFGTAHRGDASVAGVPKKLPSAAGFLMKAEIEHLGKVLTAPAKPLVMVMGGAKVSDKIGVLENLMEKVDKLIIGGGMAYTFLAARGEEIGDSLFEPDSKGVAASILDEAEREDIEVLLPVDHVVAPDLSEPDKSRVVRGAVEKGWKALDIGPETTDRFCRALQGAGTILWNGTMGVCEVDAFAKGSRKVAEEIARSPAVSIVGGGDTVAAVEKFGLEKKYTHVSTGGGAFLEFMEGKELPGIAALPDAAG